MYYPREDQQLQVMILAPTSKRNPEYPYKVRDQGTGMGAVPANS